MYTHLEETKEKEGGEPHPLKREGRGCVLSVIQAGFPFREKEGRMGREGKRERQRRKEKKQRVRDTGGRKE